MELRAWLDRQEPGALTALAKRLRVSRVHLSQLAARCRGKQPSTALAVRIEQETAGEVTRADLRPNDYWLIWPDLPAPRAAGVVSAELAPQQPQREVSNPMNPLPALPVAGLTQEISDAA